VGGADPLPRGGESADSVAARPQRSLRQDIWGGAQSADCPRYCLLFHLFQIHQVQYVSRRRLFLVHFKKNKVFCFDSKNKVCAVFPFVLRISMDP